MRSMLTRPRFVVPQPQRGRVGDNLLPKRHPAAPAWGRERQGADALSGGNSGTRSLTVLPAKPLASIPICGRQRRDWSSERESARTVTRVSQRWQCQFLLTSPRERRRGQPGGWRDVQVSAGRDLGVFEGLGVVVMRRVYAWSAPQGTPPRDTLESDVRAPPTAVLLIPGGGGVVGLTNMVAPADCLSGGRSGLGVHTGRVSEGSCMQATIRAGRASTPTGEWSDARQPPAGRQTASKRASGFGATW